MGFVNVRCSCRAVTWFLCPESAGCLLVSLSAVPDACITMSADRQLSLAGDETSEV